jgi:S-DNA-T family DNA segregation ATPase FtsK/SpoIIIE
LQRRFRIGYTRAARLIDYMEDKGIIGPPTGTSKAREVILDGASPTENSSEEEE